MKYNPFAHLRGKKDILKPVQTIIANTKGDCEKSGEDFWVKAKSYITQPLLGIFTIKVLKRRRILIPYLR